MPFFFVCSVCWYDFMKYFNCIIIWNSDNSSWTAICPFWSVIIETKITCPCCGYKTLDSIREYDICPICFWEDDPIQYDEPDYEGGANHVSLKDAQKNFIKFGACDIKMIDNVRKANNNDVKDLNFVIYND